MNVTNLDTLRESHRSWLGELGILHKPWLIFGSAPNPTLPDGDPKRWARVDINNAGRTAVALGLGRADLTIRTQRKSWAEWPELDSRVLLWTHRWPKLLMYMEMRHNSRARVDEIRRWPRGERELIVEHVIGASLTGVGKWEKVTTGIAAICYGLFVGVPQIVVAGISFDASGHSYDALARERRQVNEDAFALERLRHRPEVFTTEATLIEKAQLRSWTN